VVDGGGRSRAGGEGRETLQRDEVRWLEGSKERVIARAEEEKSRGVVK